MNKTFSSDECDRNNSDLMGVYKAIHPGLTILSIARSISGHNLTGLPCVFVYLSLSTQIHSCHDPRTWTKHRRNPSRVHFVRECLVSSQIRLCGNRYKCACLEARLAHSRLIDMLLWAAFSSLLCDLCLGLPANPPSNYLLDKKSSSAYVTLLSGITGVVSLLRNPIHARDLDEINSIVVVGNEKVSAFSWNWALYCFVLSFKLSFSVCAIGRKIHHHRTYGWRADCLSRHKNCH